MTVLFMTALVVLGAVGLVLQAILGPTEIWDLDEGAGRLTRLSKRRDRLLRTMKDLELERESGALSEDEYKTLRREHKQRAVRASRELARVRRGRLRRLARGSGKTPRRLTDRVEVLVRERSSGVAAAVLALIVGFLLAPATAGASVVVSTRLFSAEESFPPVREALRTAFDSGNVGDAFRDELKVPFADRDVVLELVNTSVDKPPEHGKVLGSWTGKTDSNGSVAVDTGLGAMPQGAAFVFSADESGASTYTRFFLGGEADASLMLYKTSADFHRLRPRLSVTYDYRGGREAGGNGEPAQLVVQIVFEISNPDHTLFIGASVFGQREILRIPVPAGAKIVVNEGPGGGSPGWLSSADGRSLLVSSPVPGLFDTFGGGSGLRWSLRYELPAVQTLVQSFKLPFTFPSQNFTVWAVHKDMEIDAPLLEGASSLRNPDAPVHKARTFEVKFSQKELAAGRLINVALTIDNAPLGQVRTRSVEWVTAFLLLMIIGAGAGLLFGRSEPAPEELYGELSGEEVLDRIVDLDGRNAAGRIRKKEYEHHREVLVRLAAEELDASEAPPAPAPASGPAASRFESLSEKVRETLRRIDELDASGRTDPDMIRERMQLLEVLARGLPRETES